MRDRTADLLHAMQALSQLSYGPGVTENEIIARHAGQHKLFFTKISEGLEALPDLGESLLPGRLWLDGAAGGCLATGCCRVQSWLTQSFNFLNLFCNT